jgi:hypothetical protein
VWYRDLVGVVSLTQLVRDLVASDPTAPAITAVGPDRHSGIEIKYSTVSRLPSSSSSGAPVEDAFSVVLKCPVKMVWNPSLVASMSVFLCHPPEIPSLSDVFASLPCLCALHDASQPCWHNMPIGTLATSLMLSEDQLSKCVAHFPPIALDHLHGQIRRWVTALLQALTPSHLLPATPRPLSSRTTQLPLRCSMTLSSLDVEFKHSYLNASTTFFEPTVASTVGMLPMMHALATAFHVDVVFQPNPEHSMCVQGRIEQLRLSDCNTVPDDPAVVCCPREIDTEQHSSSFSKPLLCFHYTSPVTSLVPLSLFERPRPLLSVTVHRACLLLARNPFLRLMRYSLHSLLDAIDVGPAWVRNHLLPRVPSLLMHGPPLRVHLTLEQCGIICPASETLSVEQPGLR